MSKRRSRLEITLTILSAILDGVDKPTRIMYAANMSWKPVQRILSHLVEQGLLLEVINTESRQSKRRYHITDKGFWEFAFFGVVNPHPVFRPGRNVVPVLAGHPAGTAAGASCLIEVKSYLHCLFSLNRNKWNGCYLYILCLTGLTGSTGYYHGFRMKP